MPTSIVELAKLLAFTSLVFFILYVACKVMGYGWAKGVLKAFEKRSFKEKNNNAKSKN